MQLLLIVCLVVVGVTTSIHGYQGILINGQYGTQIYDPLATPHVQGNMQLGLQIGANAIGGAAVISGEMAYFASGGTNCELLEMKEQKQ
jgi:hypothetical protein